MQTKVTMGGKEKSILFRKAGTVGGDEGAGHDLVVEVEALTPERLRLKIGERTAQVHVVRTAEGAWVWHDGRARFVRSGNGEAVRRGKRDHGPGLVTPPMPSTVIRVLVEVGQRVEAKAALVVVSAMKMETTLRAPYAGVVAAIHTQAGAAVRPGEILVDVTPEEEALSQ